MMLHTFLKQKETSLFIQGPSGRLEVIIEQHLEPGKEMNESPWVAIICHPHPLHGGTMNNKVVTTLSRVFQEVGALSVRFNYRGVGASEGEYGHLSGEIEDTLFILDWIKTHLPESPIVLAGFSFGGSVAIKTAIQSPHQQWIRQLITIAPAAYLINYDQDITFDFPWLLVHGWEDEVIRIDTILDWCKSLTYKPELWCLPEASHFFHGKLVRLKKKLIDYLRSEVCSHGKFFL